MYSYSIGGLVAAGVCRRLRLVVVCLRLELFALVLCLVELCQCLVFGRPWVCVRHVVRRLRLFVVGRILCVLLWVCTGRRSSSASIRRLSYLVRLCCGYGSLVLRLDFLCCGLCLLRVLVSLLL